MHRPISFQSLIIVFLLYSSSAFLFLPSAQGAVDLVALSDPQKVSLSIYNQVDLTLVTQEIMINFSKGTHQLKFSWEETRIDPTSLHIEFKNPAAPLRISDMQYPAGIQHTGIWTIEAQKPCQETVCISYFTSGISWTADYMMILSEDSTLCELNGYIRISNRSGENFQDAAIRLVVGQVPLDVPVSELADRRYPYNQPMEKAKTTQKNLLPLAQRKTIAMSAMDTVRESAAVEIPQVQAEGGEQLFLYKLKNHADLTDRWGKRLLNISAPAINTKMLFRFDTDQHSEIPECIVEMRNDTANGLGTGPLPEGTATVFQKNGNGGELRYIGRQALGYTPVGSRLTLNLGPAPEIYIAPRVMDYTRKDLQYDQKGNLTGFDEIKEVAIEIKNAMETKAHIRIEKTFPSERFKISGLSHPDSLTKKDLRTIWFDIHVPGLSGTQLGFNLLIEQGAMR